tara:strand:+ start:82 stop:330 length:249 start_codon:yes stop_codon:yes gene_type:complete
MPHKNVHYRYEANKNRVFDLLKIYDCMFKTILAIPAEGPKSNQEPVTGEGQGGQGQNQTQATEPPKTGRSDEALYELMYVDM